MILKRGFVFTLFVIYLLLAGFVSAQFASTEKQIQDSAKGLEESVENARGFTEAKKWAFIGAQWKEFLLKNKAVVAVDAFFTKINIVFLILFGMDWDLSMQMLFSFLFWIFTLFSIMKYMFSVKDGAFAFLYSLVLVVLVAQINLFEYVGKWAFALVFYKNSILWKILFFAVIVVIAILWFALNRSIASWLKRRKKNKEKDAEREDKKTFGQWVTAITGGDWRTYKKFP